MARPRQRQKNLEHLELSMKRFQDLNLCHIHDAGGGDGGGVDCGDDDDIDVDVDDNGDD